MNCFLFFIILSKFIFSEQNKSQSSLFYSDEEGEEIMEEEVQTYSIRITLATTSKHAIFQIKEIKFHNNENRKGKPKQAKSKSR
jgi:hypothetical protein